MPRNEAPVVEDPKPSVVGKFKLMAFYPVHGKFFLFEVGNPKHVLAVAPSAVPYTVAEIELLSDVEAKPVFIPDDVANNLDDVRNFVLP